LAVITTKNGCIMQQIIDFYFPRLKRSNLFINRGHKVLRP
jgi:hypothetical protein